MRKLRWNVDGAAAAADGAVEEFACDATEVGGIVDFTVEGDTAGDMAILNDVVYAILIAKSYDATSRILASDVGIGEGNILNGTCEYTK